MKVRIFSLLLATMLALGSLLAAGAAPALATLTCPSGSVTVGSGNTYVIVYESANYLADQTSNGHTLCIKASSTGGTLVPNLKNAETLNLLGMAKGIADVARRARDKQLTPDDVAIQDSRRADT